MAKSDRLTGLDSSFLHLEHDATHMHVAACAVLEGPAPAYEELVEAESIGSYFNEHVRDMYAFEEVGSEGT